MIEAVTAGAGRAAQPNIRPNVLISLPGPAPSRPAGARSRSTSPRSAGRTAAPSAKPSCEAIERTHALLRLPADYRLGIVPASDTGAMEMAIWSLLGRGR